MEAIMVQEKLSEILGDLTKMQADTADQEVPGWMIGAPSLPELNSDLAFIRARSKPDEHQPLFLPDDAEVAIALLEGSIRLDTGPQSVTMAGRHFTFATAGPGRSVTALVPLTRIICIYFRQTRVGDNGELAVTAQ